MPKNTINDIVVKRKRTVHAKPKEQVVEDVPQTTRLSPRERIEHSPMTMSDARIAAREKTEEVSRIFRRPNYPTFVSSSNNEHTGRYAIWGLAAVSIIFLVFALTSLFSGAVVTITPKSEAFTLKDADFKAQVDDLGADLHFQVMTLDGVETKIVNSTQSETVDKKASGRVVIYNNYSSAAQQLVVDTRLEDPSGKIYRIDNAVTVPGNSVVNGETVPGSVEVSVHADKSGSEYNIGLSDFTIPGFKGGPRYDKFYARSKTEIGGAVSGLMYICPDDEAEDIRTDLAVSLNDKLFKKAKSQLPKGYVLVKGATYFEVTNNDDIFTSTDSSVPVTVEGKMIAIIFDENKLARQIAGKAIGNIDGDAKIAIADLSGLVFALKNDQTTLADIKEIDFTLNGKGSLVWVIDEAKLADDLTGRNKSDLKNVLADFPDINRAEATISPFWRSKFPKNDEDIKIINTLASK